MLAYRDYEKQVYDWLMTKHNADKSFNFSLRQKGSKGAETDYFIGTEKSQYFATTFWYIPIGYPGSSSDCMGLIFYYTKTGYNYYFEFNQTRSPHDDQNKAALTLIQKLQSVLEKPIGFQRQPTVENKIFTFRTKTEKQSYDTLEEMFHAIEKDIAIIFPLINQTIADVKNEYPDFKANSLTTDDFDTITKKFAERIKRFENINDSKTKDEIKIQIETEVTNNIVTKVNFPLNQILYGPPGTGKTYHTILESAKIIRGDEAISYDDALDVFNKNLGNQIEFITFHQNYSYEDFIQGLRPDTENGSALTFEKKDGVFKRIADRALKNLEASKNPASAKKDFDLVFQELIKPLNDGDIEELEIKMKKSSFYITEVGEKSIEFRKNIGDSNHTLSINTLSKMYNLGTNNIILGGLQPYYNPILELLLEKGKSNVQSVEKENFVIIIDEINRANISRVFGELITLIEGDKRSHGKIPLRVTLPSGDSFIVPSNLHIIGTMNTADKSIALLDIALRRRFEFVPMYPELTIEGLNDSHILDAINKAILDRKTHDFTIGHAYFMGEGYNREKTINNKVIPLLLEYFMNDEKEVKAILKSAQIDVDCWPLKMV